MCGTGVGIALAHNGSTGGTDIVVAGNVGSVDNGMSITAYGYMVNHPSYGEQFRAETCEASLPQDTAALLSYLSSGVLPYRAFHSKKDCGKIWGAYIERHLRNAGQTL